MRKSSTVWIWQHDKRTDDNKIILNLCKKIDEIFLNQKKRPGKAQSSKKVGNKLKYYEYDYRLGIQKDRGLAGQYQLL